jgi:hypothetical protein
VVLIEEDGVMTFARCLIFCGKQIRELHQFSFEEELQAELKARNQSVVAESPVG